MEAELVKLTRDKDEIALVEAGDKETIAALKKIGFKVPRGKSKAAKKDD